MHHKQIKAAMGIKIVAPDLEKAIAGSRLLVCGPDDDEEELREEVMSDMTNLFSRVDSGGRGVFVQASTLGSLEALLEFLKSDAVKIPVAGINIGPVHKKDIMRCATMLEKAPEFAVVLCFDVPVDKDAEDQAAKLGVKIFKGASASLPLPVPPPLLVRELTRPLLPSQPTSSTTSSTSSWCTRSRTRRSAASRPSARPSSPAASASFSASPSVIVRPSPPPRALLLGLLVVYVVVRCR